MLSKLILCCMRGRDNDTANRETVRAAGEFLGKGVCAVDLAGNEAAYPTSDFEELFLEVRHRGIPMILHAGEAAGAESIRSALDFGAVRIGHGIHAIDDPALMEELAERKVVLELCFSSNLQTKAAASPETYPLVLFHERGLCTTVNTDNMTVSDTTLQKEYQLLQKYFSLDETTLETMALNAAEGAFVSDKEREILKSKINRDFAGWL